MTVDIYEDKPAHANVDADTQGNLGEDTNVEMFIQKVECDLPYFIGAHVDFIDIWL